MRVLFICPYPQGKAASQRFRFEQYLPLLSEKGIKYTFASFWSAGAWAILYQKGYSGRKAAALAGGFARRLMLLPQLPFYTHIFIHREATPVGPPWFEWLAAKVFRKKIIYDFDDAIWLANTSADNRQVAKYKWHHKTGTICRWSHIVSCGNNYLEAYALKYNAETVLVPTTIDTSYHQLPEEKQQRAKVTIGWTGSHSTLPYLHLLEPTIQRLEQQYDFDFLVIADRAPTLRLKSLVYLPWRKETEIKDLLRIDIGIMPLPDTEWAKGKCALKALQYMALGIPTVVSAVGANLAVVPQGESGYTCRNEEEWYTNLAKLLTDDGLRTRMGSRGRAWVQQHYSVDANKQTFLSLFR